MSTKATGELAAITRLHPKTGDLLVLVVPHTTPSKDRMEAAQAIGIALKALKVQAQVLVLPDDHRLLHVGKHARIVDGLIDQLTKEVEHENGNAEACDSVPASDREGEGQ